MIEKLNRSVLRAELSIDEGTKLRAYRDTVGKLSIGTGRNLDDVGLLPDELARGWTVRDFVMHGCTAAQALIMLDNDITRTAADLDRKLPWWRTLDDIRQRVMVNMCFNMGIGDAKGGFLSFSHTLNYIRTGQYAKAREGMLSSKWAKQVGKRATRLADLMSPK